MLEHPMITRLRATGVSEPLGRARRICRDCGAGLRHGDAYYCVAGEVYCPQCVDSYRKEVEI